MAVVMMGKSRNRQTDSAHDRNSIELNRLCYLCQHVVRIFLVRKATGILYGAYVCGTVPWSSKTACQYL